MVNSDSPSFRDYRILMVGTFPKGALPQQGLLLKHYLEKEGSSVRLTARTARRWFRPIEVALDCAVLGWQQDLFIVQIFGGPSFISEAAAILIGRFYRKRIICILRGGNLPFFAKEWPRWVAVVLSCAQQVVAPSSYLQVWARQIGVPALLIPNVIEIEKYKFVPRKHLAPKFLWMRTFHSIYNPLMALQAFEEIKRLYPDATMTMAGKEGPELAICREYVERRHLSGLEFAGMVEKDNVPQFAAKHDVWLNTNDVDNMPVTLIEMWALGLPVVTTDAEGILHLVRPNGDAIVVPRKQPKAMANACVALLNDPKLSNRLVWSGRRRAEACTWPELRLCWKLALQKDKPCVES
jgi:L-malate glycosyltransferase